MHHGHHVGTTNRKKYTFKRFQCIQCFTALFRFKTTVGHPNIVGPILQWRFKKIHAPLTFCVHDLCVHGMCMACAWHVHDMCLPVMCLVCAWCVPGVCPDTVVSAPPLPPHTHMPCPHNHITTHTTATCRCCRGYHRCSGVPKHPTRHAASAAGAAGAATPTAAAAAATYHMCRRLHGRCRACCCCTGRPPPPPAAAATACAARRRRCCMLPLPDYHRQTA